MWGTVWCATGSVGHGWCAMRSTQTVQSYPYNILDKSTGRQMVQGRNPDADCAPALFLSTSCSLGCASPPAWYIQGSHMGATATSGHSASVGSLMRSLLLLHSRMLMQPVLPGPSLGSLCHQPAFPWLGHLPAPSHTWEQGQSKAGAGAGSGSAQGQLLILAVGAG